MNTYRVRNWREYNQSLVSRGSVTVWIDEKKFQEWETAPVSSGRGRPRSYSDDFILMALTVKLVYKLTYRMTEGFVFSVLRQMNCPFIMADYTTLSRRAAGVELPPLPRNTRENLVIAIDSTGLKLYGEGEWKTRQHGVEKRREWRKIHLGINVKTQQIEAVKLSRSNIQDCQVFKEVIDAIPGNISEILGDSAYDRFSCYEASEQRGSILITPPQVNSRTSKERSRNKKKASIAAVSQRDKTIDRVRELSRKEWKKEAGYHRRSLAETAMFRLKTLLGPKLSARKADTQHVEATLRCHVLNKMTSLGMPQTYRVAS